MDIHKNARLTPLGRERMVKLVLGGQTPKAVSEAVGRPHARHFGADTRCQSRKLFRVTTGRGRWLPTGRT